MKTPCRTCGCHFGDEFEATLKSVCEFWKDNNADELSQESKKKFWEWLATMPADEIFVRDNYVLSLYYSFEQAKKENRIEEIIPGYLEMTEGERQAAQKGYFLAKQSFTPVVIKQQSSLFKRIFDWIGISFSTREIKE